MFELCLGERYFYADIEVQVQQNGVPLWSSPSTKHRSVALTPSVFLVR